MKPRRVSAAIEIARSVGRRCDVITISVNLHSTHSVFDQRHSVMLASHPWTHSTCTQRSLSLSLYHSFCIGTFYDRCNAAKAN